MDHPRLLLVAIVLSVLAIEIGGGTSGALRYAASTEDDRSFASVGVAATASAPTSSQTNVRLEATHLGDTLSLWNGEILWAPAAASADPVTRFGDELRSVFGPIPDGDCAGPHSKRLGLEVDGNAVELEPNLSKAGSPLEFAHRDLAGRLVKWTTSIPKCDKPSLAGGVTFCGTNSRISRVKQDHVEWLFLCRKSSDNLEMHADPYWSASDPRFSRYSAIGFNDVTGEIAFVDGRKDRSVFDWSKSFPPPGGRSYNDAAGRRDAEELYDKTFHVNCVACHDNKKPAIIDPHMQQARVGYFDGGNDPRAAGFSLGNFLPGRIARAGSPFRVIGSDYTSVHEGSLRGANVVAIQGHPCSACHTLTTTESGRRFAADAVAMPPTIEAPTVAQNAAIVQEKAALSFVQDHRTEWASSAGIGRILPWMIPEHGGKLSKGTRKISQTEWAQLGQCVWGNGGNICNYRPLFTSCPAPGRNGDTFVPFDFALRPHWLTGELADTANVLYLTWKYLNGYGDVPQRDDVRFNIAVKVEDIPASQTSPDPHEYPTIDEAKGVRFVSLHKNLGWSGTAMLLQNASFDGHRQWTDPPLSDQPRLYSIAIPATCGKRYLIRVLPKRFCFDYSGISYSDADYLVYRDNTCTK